MVFDKIFVYGFSFIVTLNVANYYGTLVYGKYQYALSVVSLFNIFISFVDGRVVKKFYLDNPEDVITWNASFACFVCSIVSFLIGLFYVFICHESLDIKILFIILLLNSVILGFRFGMQCRYEYILQSKKIVISSNVALTISGIIQLLAISYNCDIYSIAIIITVSGLINFLILLFQYKIQFKRLIFKNVDRKLIYQLIFFSMPFSIGGACTIIYSKCDSIMIGNIMTKSEVGIYSIANSFIMVTLMAIDPIRESIFPSFVELYNRNKTKYIDLYISITSLLTWICIIGIGISFAVLPYIIRILKPEYGEALYIFFILVINSLFMYNAALRAGHFTITNSGHVLMVSQITSVFINVLLNYVLINQYGVYGAALATVITQFISLYISNVFWGHKGVEVLKWQIKGFNPLYCFRYIKTYIKK